MVEAFEIFKFPLVLSTVFLFYNCSNIQEEINLVCLFFLF